MNFLSVNRSKSLWAIVVILLTLNSSIPTIAQSKFFKKTATNDDYAYSDSNENYVLYSVSAGNTDGGFRYMGIIREDKKTKERVVLYKGGPIFSLMVCGDWFYFDSNQKYNYINRMKVDGSEYECFKIGSYPFIYKERLYFSEFNALKFYDLKTMDVQTASTEITTLDAICNDVGILFDEQDASYTMVQLDPESGVVTSAKTYKLNGLDYYFRANIMVNEGYLYYSGMNDPNGEFNHTQNVLYRSKLGDNDAMCELVTCLPTVKTGASMAMQYTVGMVMDDECMYINYRAMLSPDNGEIWRYSLDGKIKKRTTILLTNAMSKCEDWIYTMGQWTWEQRRTNVKTGQQELLFRGKADDLSALNSLKSLVPLSPPVVHPKSIATLAKPDATLYPNAPTITVDKQHKYKQQGYSLTEEQYAKKYYRVDDVAEMLSNTNKAFYYKIEGNTVTFTTESDSHPVRAKKKNPAVSLKATRRTGYMAKGSTKNPITFYEADGEQFYLFRDILGILGVNVEGNNVTTTK